MSNLRRGVEAERVVMTPFSPSVERSDGGEGAGRAVREGIARGGLWEVGFEARARARGDRGIGG